MDKRTYRIATLGCRTNQYESQAYKDQLESLGFQPAAPGEEAEVCIVNTCTVTRSADRDGIAQIKKLAKGNPASKLLVTGCLADRVPGEIATIAGVTHVVANKDKQQLLSQALPGEELPEFSITRFDAHTRAFVKVQDGCNSFCTYCIIPYVRGRSRSRSLTEVVKEVETLVSNGYKEVVLTGINIGDYDGGGGEARANLAQLVRTVDAVPGLQRLRLSSIDPDEVDDDLADAVLNGKRTCPSMHIVLQSGSNLVLKRMNRKYTRQMFSATIARLRAARPDFTFTTDIIVGFPGESDGDFEETLGAMEEAQFAKVHLFPYSPRPRTRAALYPDAVAPQLLRDRQSRALRYAEEVAYRLRERFVGQTADILVEESAAKESCGHTANFLRVRVPGGTAPRNAVITVRLARNTPSGLIGEEIA